MDGNVIPVVHIFFGGFDQFQLLLRIINQGAQFATFRFANVASKQFAYLASDITRSILQYMLESLAFSMKVGQKMFCTFRQVHDSLQIDNLCRCRCNGRKRGREQLQIVHVTMNSCLTHSLIFLGGFLLEVLFAL